jgi:ubiquinone biosynthesis accessory factor UbiK
MAVIDPKFLDNLASRLAATLPSGIRELKEDTEKNFRAVLQGTFAKLNLVTREEFDVQTAVLNRAQAKLHDLEEQIVKMEKQLKTKKHKDDASQ